MHGGDEGGRAGSGAPSLLERDSERDALAALIEAAASGTGRAGIVEGQPGIGKTALLNTARAMADARGVTCLAASGSEYEQTFPFGVARQLFEPALAALSARARAEVLSGAAGLARDVADTQTVEPDGPPPDRLALEHGLYWLCLNLSSLTPLVLVVDDAHWADESSLRWLHYLARRIADAPIAIVVAARSTHPEGPVPVVEAIKSLAATTVLGPRPLSVAAARTVIAEVFGAEPDDDFARASHAATAGNPFLLIELARSLRADGLEPTTANAALTSQVRPEAVARSVLARLARLSPDAVAVAQVSAVLPDRAPLRHAARLAHVDVESAAAAVDELVAAGLLDAGGVIRLAHPIVRAALDGELASGERARLHGEAARLLAGDGERGERVAGHLMLTVPAGDDWVVAELRRAAREALARGAPETVARYLRRAVDEPPRPEERARVIGELGLAEAQAGLGTAVEHLRAAAEQVQDPRERALLARSLAQMLFQSGRPDAAVQALNDVLARPLDADARLTLEAEAMAMTEIGGLHDGGAPDAPTEVGGGDPEGDSPGRRCLLATRAARLSRRAPGTARQVVALAVAALGDGALAAGEGAGSLFFSAAVTALVWSDAFEEAEPEVDRALARGRAGGSRFAVGQGSWLAGLLALCRGRLADAEMHERASLEQATQIDRELGDVPAEDGRRQVLLVGMLPTVAVLVEALVERGRLDDAQRELEGAGLLARPPPVPLSAFVLDARARLAIARVEPAAALADALAAGELANAWGAVNPSVVGWRSTAALASLQLADRDEAARLAAENLELAEAYGAPRALGIALRVDGVVTGGERGIESLERAVDLLSASGADLEHARALAELGAALRRARRRAEAREPLRAALDLATRCGASPLAERAHAELAATGARPRRVVLSGADALTAREREVAQMAAAGGGNVQIAQALFVTRGTVEKHLEAVFRKLGIHSRDEIAPALTGDG